MPPAFDLLAWAACLKSWERDEGDDNTTQPSAVAILITVQV